MPKLARFCTYPWTASVWYHGGLTATPNCNLVRNIGFEKDGTHTKKKGSKFENMAVASLGGLTHPKIDARSKDADNYVFRHVFGGKYRGLKGLARRVVLKPTFRRLTGNKRCVVF